MRIRHLLTLVLTVTAMPVVTAYGAEAAPRRPNIVLIVADDLGYRDIGAFGQDKIRTPNIDRLAGEGVRLTAHYSGNTVCAPSRNVLLSGLHPGHTFIRDNKQAPQYARVTHEGQYPVPPGHLQLPLTLKRLDYATGGFGKWGLGPWNSTGNPNEQGMDRFYGYICQAVAHNYYPSYLWDNGKQVPLNNPEPDRKPRLADGADPSDPRSYEPFVGGTDYAPDRIAEQALAFVREHKDQPFFLYYPTVVPHLGYQVPPDSLKEYEGKFPEEPYPGSGQYVPDRTPRATYAAMITRMDREVGRIVSLIRELGLDDHTIFIFTSDNGAPGGIPTSYFNSGGIFRGGKGSIYDGGFRVPTIVRWNGRIKPGASSDRVTGFEDWLPTLVELVGDPSATPANLDGISFAPTLLGESQEQRPFLYREFPARGGAQFVRSGDWKLIRHLGGPNAKTREFVGGGVARHPPGALDPELRAVEGDFELFDLATDPSEQHNVALDHPDIVARLAKLLDEQHAPSNVFPLAIDEKGN
ncbi:MAG TPA: arylsulfatase [Tepidisphaeraceae bacterium]|nr:arylsulfatase [Tepidisphaeraceae bacterium]